MLLHSAGNSTGINDIPHGTGFNGICIRVLETSQDKSTNAAIILCVLNWTIISHNAGPTDGLYIYKGSCRFDGSSSVQWTERPLFFTPSDKLISNNRSYGDITSCATAINQYSKRGWYEYKRASLTCAIKSDWCFVRFSVHRQQTTVVKSAGNMAHGGHMWQTVVLPWAVKAFAETATDSKLYSH